MTDFETCISPWLLQELFMLVLPAYASDNFHTKDR